MTKAVLGIIGGSGLYDLPGSRMCARSASQSPWGEPSAPLRDRRDRRAPHRVPVAPRQGPQAVAHRHQLSRQYRRAEAGRGHRPRVARRPAARSRRSCRPAPSCWSISSSTAPSPRQLVLRQGLRGACVDGASGQPALAHPSRRGRGGRGHPRRPRAAPMSASRARNSPRSPRASPIRASAIR